MGAKPLEIRNLGRSGLRVSAIGLGCNNFGWYIDLEAARAVVHKALDSGITLFDTAETYGPYVNEELLGRALSERRDGVVIASKFGFDIQDGKVVGLNSRPEHIRQAVDAMLQRLRTDRIDLHDSGH